MPTDRSAPGVRLTLFKDEKATTGEPLDLGGRLLSMTFEDCDDKADKLSLQLDNFDLSLFDREELMGGAVLEVSWGYPGNMSPPRRVVIKSMKGFQQVTLEGQALSTLMNQQAKTRRWEGKTRSDVVREVAKDAGYEGAFVDIEDTAETIGVINQAAETDARFLTRLAAVSWLWISMPMFSSGSRLRQTRVRSNGLPALLAKNTARSCNCRT